ncbi:MAG: hypothetical protein IPL86_19175 [Flavobacteriales bacterium]|nr:hypothetical protein [Flavobacteriales bacterium]
MSWITENWVNILAAATSLVTTASVLVKFTPDTHDDEIVAAALKFLQWLSINGKPKA